MNTSTRIDFISGVPDTLYRRSGGKCSVPRCKNPTMGPFKENEKAVNMGVACHIYSASKNGPRGWGGKPSEFISSAKNGIWCCQYHASLIDKNKGNDYPVSVLFLWKKLIETRVLKEMNDFPSPLGWVDSIEFTTFLNYTALPKLKLSRYTLIFGKNGVGKTVLLEIAAAISNSKYANRFNGTSIKNENENYIPAVFEAKVVYTTVDYPHKEINLKIEDKQLFRMENRINYLLPPGDLEVIYSSNKDKIRSTDEDDIDYMMRVLNVDKSALFAICNIGTKTLITGTIMFEHAEEDDEEKWDKTYPKYKDDGEPYYELMFKPKDRDEFICFNCLSSSEQGMLILDLQITKAKEIAKQRLTLLLIEDLAIVFDENNFQNLLQVLEKEDFQVIVSIPPYITTSIINNKSKDLEYLKQWKLEEIGIKN